jgi:ribosomal protein L37E
MKDIDFKAVKPLIEMAGEQLPRMLQSAEAEQLKLIMRKASAALPEGCEVFLNIELCVFDPERGESLPLATQGISAIGGKEPFLTSGDSTVHRYIVDGEICQVPHDRCPHCWGKWDFKLRHPECPRCSYAMGRQVKMLLDSNVCPHCEKGTVSMTSPTCEQCGFEVDLRMVTWGQAYWQRQNAATALHMPGT